MNKKQNLVKGVLFFVLSSVDMYTQTSPESVAEVKTDVLSPPVLQSH